MTVPPSPPAALPKKRSLAKGCGIFAAAIVGLFVLSAVIAGIAGAGKKGTAKAEAKPSAPAVSKPSSSAGLRSKPTMTSSSRATSEAVLPPTEARKKAAAILHANDSYYQDEFNNGVTVTLNRGNPDSFPAFHTWQQKAATDVQPGMDAFKRADALFNADDEPASISDWQADNGQLSADIAQLADDGLGVGGPDDATYRQKVQDDARKFPHDFQTAEADADKVAAGK
ncbi:hypothetical protein ACFOSC_01065 [Streptantibioticus rubrisoli]|uniref:Uncharacterized protein n=1 Tax=Streptantibioticus rubrisoli TaxID=1387313 RepID=A0ABT1PD45_9ACTN|nr:hypothetical protein [Streptantibioticus rubrisoli]MCQ4043284.1 hypothetical protein [Streptantibioticus rubrisoli]